MRRKNRSRNIAPRRRPAGQAIAEFGPALGIILICIFFPLVDMLAVGMAYGFLMVLNYNQTHEASLLPATEANSATGAVKKIMVDKWSSGMGHFCNLASPPGTSISYRANTVNSDKVTDQTVIVTTTATCNPFLPIPLPVAHVPGLNGPMFFSVSSERPMENPDDVNN